MKGFRPKTLASRARGGSIRWTVRPDATGPDETGRGLRLDTRLLAPSLPDVHKARLEKQIRAALFEAYEVARATNKIEAVRLPAKSRFRPWFARFLARVGVGRGAAGPGIKLEEAEGQGRR